MQESVYADPAFQDHGFVNHLAHVVYDAGVHPGTTDPLIELYSIELMQNLQATSGTGGKPRNIALFYKPIPLGGTLLSGAWQLIEMWEEGVDYEESSAAASVAIHPTTGNVHVELSFGKRNAAGAMQYQKWEAQINRTTFAAPIERLPVAKEEKGDPGPQGPPGPQGIPGPAGSGGALTPEQESDLAWLHAARAVISGA